MFGEYCETFDTMAISPRRDLLALMTDTGTTGLLVSPDGRPIRELTRSGYKADAYRYPLVLCTLPDGRTGLIHCPDKYNRLEVEVAATGERLTDGSEREPSDFFHSRLAVSPDGRYLLSAGWVWQPWYGLAVYDLEKALADPTSAKTSRSARPRRKTTMLARWSLADRSFVWRSQLDRPAGDVVPFAGDFLALYDHPRLYDGATGDLIAAWPDLPTGHAEGPIVSARSFSGPRRVAVDEIRRRFAVTDGERTTVVHLG
ncbi:hypothetical protein [Amycolatopsis sp. WAC 04197]|uniref:hypothetical protein n=1 Tax=Amycolatopsis sp. WAC 04197 TaxID=2203199 RepID=UPI000F77152A|nr:hypothetical protein [Amycolatopsis sp. WAC 04197]